MNIPIATVEAENLGESTLGALKQKTNMSNIDTNITPSHNYASSTKLMVSSFCQHVKIIKNKDFDNCFHCGVQVPRVIINYQFKIFKKSFIYLEWVKKLQKQKIKSSYILFFPKYS